MDRAVRRTLDGDKDLAQHDGRKPEGGERPEALRGAEDYSRELAPG